MADAPDIAFYVLEEPSEREVLNLLRMVWLRLRGGS